MGMTRTYTFMFTVECAGPGEADLPTVENMIDLTMQELLMGDDFIDALDEKESVTIQVNLVK
jgi:hypothetical protein